MREDEKEEGYEPPTLYIHEVDCGGADGGGGGIF